MLPLFRFLERRSILSFAGTERSLGAAMDVSFLCSDVQQVGPSDVPILDRCVCVDVCSGTSLEPGEPGQLSQTVTTSALNVTLAP